MNFRGARTVCGRMLHLVMLALLVALPTAHADQPVTGLRLGRVRSSVTAPAYFSGTWTFNGSLELWLCADGSYLWRRSLFACVPDPDGVIDWTVEEHGWWECRGWILVLHQSTPAQPDEDDPFLAGRGRFAVRPSGKKVNLISIADGVTCTLLETAPPETAVAVPADGAALTVTGVLSSRVFPGPPNYESVTEGDAAEPAWILTVGRGSGAVEYHLAAFDPALSAQLRSHEERALRIRGLAWEALTGHQRTSPWIEVQKVEPIEDGK